MIYEEQYLVREIYLMNAADGESFGFRIAAM
jgi:hypothetical protein